jgi:hypothetical protein
MQLSGESMKVRDDQLLWREVDGEVVILDLAGSVYFTTNKTGAKLWELMQQDRTIDELVEALVQEFGVDQSVARQDVEVFIAELREADLITT